MNRLLNQLILIAGAWRDSGFEDETLGQQMDNLFTELMQKTGLDHQGVERLLRQHLRGEVAA